MKAENRETAGFPSGFGNQNQPIHVHIPANLTKLDGNEKLLNKVSTHRMMLRQSLLSQPICILTMLHLCFHCRKELLKWVKVRRIRGEFDSASITSHDFPAREPAPERPEPA